MHAVKIRFTQFATTIHDLTNGRMLVLFILIGVLTHASGLFGQFQGDDQYQIVSNDAIHSLGNIGQFFTSGTFYNGEQLTGTFYRPLMTTVFSMLYSVFGATPFVYHAVQLGLFIGSAYLLYLLFSTWFKKIPAFVAALLFLVHPITTQIVYSIPCMQDALYMFFGLLALWLLSTFRTPRATAWAVFCALLALFSKETAIVFIVVLACYALLFKHKYAKHVLIAFGIITVLYLLLRYNAVGVTQNNADMSPITNATVGVRLLTAPSIITFYLSKLLIPFPLTTSYYWLITAPSFGGFLLPLVISLLFFALVIYLGLKTYSRNRGDFKLYLLFMVFVMLGLLMHLQIIPLDMTASETWAYPMLIGLLGLGVLVYKTVKLPLVVMPYISVFAAIILGVFAVLSFLRGYDYASQYTLYSHDLAVNEANFLAHNNVAQALIDQKQLPQAKTHALRSIQLHPNATNYSNLGVAEQYAGNYNAAEQAYQQALKYDSFSAIYENLALVKFSNHKGAQNVAYFKSALQKYPHSAKIWLYLALEQADMADPEAVKSIAQAAQYTAIPQQLYTAIANHQPVSFQVPNSGRTIQIK